MKKDRTFDMDTARERNYLGNRIEAARKGRGWSLERFSRELSSYGLTIAKQGLSKWETGVTVPNGYQLMAVSRALGIPDLLMGYEPELNDEGMRKLSEYKKDLIASGRYTPVSSEIEYIEMPVSCLAASAGTGMFLDEGSYEMIRVPRSIVPHGAEFGVRVSGDSMEPAFHDGQIVWVQSCDQIAPGEVGIFGYAGDGYIKAYAEQDPEDQDAFTDSRGIVHKQPVMVSYNKKYAPRVISPDEEFRIFGRVLR